MQIVTTFSSLIADFGVNYDHRQRKGGRRMKTLRVLFVCTYCGTRSLIAEKLTNRLAPGKIEAHSSSFESGKINPLAIAVMKEVDIDLPTDAPKSVWDRFVEKEAFDWVVTLCDETSSGQ